MTTPTTPPPPFDEEYSKKIQNYKQEILKHMRDTLKMSSDDAFATIGAIFGVMIVASTTNREAAYAICNEYVNALKRVVDEYYDDREQQQQEDANNKRFN